MKAPHFILALLTVLASALPLSAADVVGVITGVDLDKKEVSIEGRGRARGKMLTLVLDADTQVLFGKQAATASDLVNGRRVNVEYEDRDGKQVARVLHVHGPKPTASAVPTDKGALTGILRRVALTDREIVVIGPGEKGKETETTVAVPETARIMKGGKAVSLEALKEDDPISVAAEKRDGRLTATTIQVGPGGPAEKATVVPRIRIALKVIDAVLQQLEKPER